MQKTEVLIRKYSDRRLYDTGASRYVTLEDIAQMVREGINVRVVDGRTGKDLTRMVLTQVIMEEAKERQAALPLQLLTQLVRASDKATHDFLSWYLDTAQDLYQKAQKTVSSGLADAKNVVANPVDFVRKLLPGQASSTAAEGEEVEKLRRQLEELQRRLADREKASPRRAKRRRAARRPA